MNSNHTHISSNTNNENSSYTDFMLSSHLKAPIMNSSTSNENNNNCSYQEKKSPIASPSKNQKVTKKSLNNTFKNQFSTNSMLQNKMQQLASVANTENDFDKYRSPFSSQKKDKYSNRSFLTESPIISPIENNKNLDALNPLAQQSQTKQNIVTQTNQTQLLNNNLAAMTAAYPNLVAYFPPPPPPPPLHTIIPPGQSSASKNSALLAASSIYSAYFAAAANTNRAPPNLNPYLPYLQAIAQHHSLTPTQQQQLIQNQTNQNDFFMNAAAALAAASSFGALGNPQHQFQLQQQQQQGLLEIKKSTTNDQALVEKKARSRSRSPLQKKKQKLSKNNVDEQITKDTKSKHHSQDVKSSLKRTKHERSLNNLKNQIEKQSYFLNEEPLDLSIKVNNNEDDDCDSIMMKYNCEEEYEGDNDEDEEGEVQNNWKSKKLKTEFKASSSFTVDKILSNNLNFTKASKLETIDSFINDERENPNQSESPPLLYTATNSPSSSSSDNVLLNAKSNLKDNNNFTCNFCEETFKSRVDFESHLIEHNTEESLYRCTECEISFKKSFKLQSHIISKNHKNSLDKNNNLNQFDKSEYSCLKCKREFLSKTILEKHNFNEKFKSICSDSEDTSDSSNDETYSGLNKDEKTKIIKVKEDECVDSTKEFVSNIENSALDLTISNTKANEPIELIYSTTLPSPSQSQTSASNSPNSAISSSSNNSNDNSHFSHHHNNIHHNNGLLHSLKFIQ